MNREVGGLGAEKPPITDYQLCKKKVKKIKKRLTNKQSCVIIKVQKRDTKEVIKMMNINFDTYQLICDLLDNDDLDLADIAVMAGVTLADVQYVDRAENDVM